MSQTLYRDGSPMCEQLFNPMLLSPVAHGLHLAGEKVDHSESRSPQLAGNWQKRENTDRSEVEEDARVHELMEAVKRYIRSIDVTTL